MIEDILTAQQYIAQFDVEEQLTATPKSYDAPATFYEPGLKAIFYDSVTYQGKPTRCFAWLGMPEGASKEHPVPAIVLIHGGGGTALANWVKRWNSIGYAAISMDTCGAMPCWSAIPGWHPAWPRHEYSGAPGCGGFDRVDLPPKDQWAYQATAAVLRATALLRSLPEVKADQIGVAGISWGGVLTLIASAVAPKNTFTFAIPVYASCHFTDDYSSTAAPFNAEQIKKWTQLWDPAPALRESKTPTLFLTDAEDQGFALPTWERTTEMMAKEVVHRSMRIRYTHDHDASMYSKTEASFAEACLNKQKLPEWGLLQSDGKKYFTTLEMHGRRVASCQLCFTRAEGFWGDRRWNDIPAKVVGNQVEAEIYPHTTAAFFNIVDDYGCIWSSPACVIK